MSKGNGNDRAKRNGKPQTDGRDVKGKFTVGNQLGFKPGEVANPSGRPRKVSYAKLSAGVDAMPASGEPWAVEICKMLRLDSNKLTCGEVLIRADKVNRAKGGVGYLREDNNRCEGRVPIRAEIAIEMQIAFQAAAEIVFQAMRPMLTDDQLSLIADRVREAACGLNLSDGRYRNK